MTTQTDKINLLLDSARGQYIPRDFAQGFDITKFEGISKWAIEQCQDPENEDYWDAWCNILERARYTEDGRVFYLHQNGDLWLLCFDELTEEEKSNFFED